MATPRKKNTSNNDPEELIMDVNFKPSTVIRTVVIVMLTILAIGAVTKMRTPITLILTSFFLAVALNPPVSRLSRYMPKGSRGLSVAIAYLLVISVIGGLLFSVVPPVAKQIGNFANTAPQIVKDIQNNPDNRTGEFIRKYGLEDEVDKVSENIKKRLGDVGQFAFNSAQAAINALISLITILVLTFLMLVDGPIMLRRFFSRYQDQKTKEAHYDLLHKMYRVVTAYFNGQVFVTTISSILGLSMMIIVGWIFDAALPYPLVLTSAIWISGLIPLIGATLGAFIVVSVSAFVSWKVALVLAIYFFIYQQIENATIQPIIQGKAVSMSPLIVLIVVLLSASLGGLFLAFIALPVAGSLQLFFNEYMSDSSNIGTKQRRPTWLSKTIKVGQRDGQ